MKKFITGDIAIKVRSLNKTFELTGGRGNTIREKVRFWNKVEKRQLKALSNINFDVRKGEFFGVIGKNGSGKSTLIRMLIGAMKADKGSKIEVKGKMIRMALGMGFDPNLSARDNIYVNGSILGLTFKRIGLIFDDIINFAELEDFVEVPVKHYSSGMRSRLTFAIAMHTEADIFLMDEFFGGVGDQAFRKKSEDVFERTFLEGRTILHVSHGMGTIQKYCDRVLLLDKGRQIKIGTPQEVIPIYNSLFKK